MSKKVEILRCNSSCMANAYKVVREKFNLNENQAYKITQAVDNDYKYLKVIE